MKTIAIIILAISAFLLFKKGQRPEVSTITGDAMGTTWSLRCQNPEQYQTLIHITLEIQENLFSHWRANSELSKLNAGRITEPSEELAKALDLAARFKAETGGAFDHTLLRQTQETHFAPQLPTTAHSYDLSAMAKGYSIDVLTKTLREHGLTDFIVELGGECFASGTQQDGSPWPVQIPSPTGGDPVIVHLSDQAIATSGNYHQIAGVQNKRIISHLIDPTTGKPRPAVLSSVSIIAPDCATADAYATARFVSPDLALPNDLQIIELPADTP